MLTTYTFALPSLVASSLKRRPSISQTPVSSDGTEAKSRTPDVSLNDTVPRLWSTTVKSGASWPTSTGLPTSVTGLPRIVICICFPPWDVG